MEIDWLGYEDLYMYKWIMSASFKTGRSLRTKLKAQDCSEIMSKALADLEPFQHLLFYLR